MMNVSTIRSGCLGTYSRLRFVYHSTRPNQFSFRSWSTSSKVSSKVSSNESSTSRSQSSEEDTVEHFDIVINGGGVVGFTLLATLSRNPYFSDKKILLLEQQPQKAKASSESSGKESDLMEFERTISNRVSSITLSSKEFLDKNLNIWSSIASFSKECKSMHIWSDEYQKGITFNPRYPGISDLTCPFWEPNHDSDDNVCFFVENHRLLQALERTVPFERVKYGSSVTDIRSSGTSVHVHLDGGHTDRLDTSTKSDQHNPGSGSKVIKTSLIVGCDGFNSLVRSKSNLKYFQQDLKQKGIVGTVEMVLEGENDMNEIAFQRFLPEDGSVIALLPISNNYSSIVISTGNERAERLMNLSEEDFVQELNNLLSKRSVQKPLKATVKSAIDNLLVYLPFLPKHALPRRLTLPEVASVVPGSRASFPLFFGSTLPYAVGSVLGTAGSVAGSRRMMGARSMMGAKSGSSGHGSSNLVLIGDALHRIPPLAGQGLNLGIGDAIELSACLSESLERGEAIFGSSGSETTSGNESLSNALDRFERRRQIKLLPMMAAVASMSQVFTTVPTSLITQFNHLNSIKNEIVKFANSR